MRRLPRQIRKPPKLNNECDTLLMKAPTKGFIEVQRRRLKKSLKNFELLSVVAPIWGFTFVKTQKQEQSHDKESKSTNLSRGVNVDELVLQEVSSASSGHVMESDGGKKRFQKKRKKFLAAACNELGVRGRG